MTLTLTRLLAYVILEYQVVVVSSDPELRLSACEMVQVPQPCAAEAAALRSRGGHPAHPGCSATLSLVWCIAGAALPAAVGAGLRALGA